MHFQLLILLVTNRISVDTVFMYLTRWTCHVTAEKIMIPCLLSGLYLLLIKSIRLPSEFVRNNNCLNIQILTKLAEFLD